MSVLAYLGCETRELRLRAGDVPRAGMEAQVLEGKLSVEEALAVAARRAWRAGEAYGSAALYDPVLRSHCRLEGEGLISEEESGT